MLKSINISHLKKKVDMFFSLQNEVNRCCIFTDDAFLIGRIKYQKPAEPKKNLFDRSQKQICTYNIETTKTD